MAFVFQFLEDKRTKNKTKQSCLYFCTTSRTRAIYEKYKFILVTFAIPPMRTGGRAMIIQPEIKEKITTMCSGYLNLPYMHKN
jgi:hypothetical protein